MMRRQIVANALTTFAQVIGSAATLFFLYRFLIRAVGLERLGIWSLVLATTSVVTLANQGYSTSIIKFVAKYAARGRPEKVSLLMQTAVITIGLALAVVSATLYPVSKWVLVIVLPHRNISEALAILPLALVSLWLTIIEGVLQACLAGLQCITVCNYLEFGGSASYLLLAFLLVPGHGLLGLAYAQAIQSAAILLVTWLLLRRRMKFLPIVPRCWSRSFFNELAAYGFHFQLITASQALREPVTRVLLAKFGGLALTGFYDLAARCVFTLRELLVQANQVLVPTISHLQERDPKFIPAVYRASYRLMFFLAVPAFTSLAVLSPFISRIWIGRYEPVFVEFVVILSAGWLVNVLANPAYVVDLGTGALRWVSVGCISTAVLNAVLGFLAGSHLGGPAVVAAAAISLAAGYLIVLAAYHLENRAPFSQLLPRESGGIVFTSIVGALVFLPLFRAALAHASFSFRTAAGAIAALIALLFIPVWLHPMRKQLLRWVFSRVPA
jgi:O-antigen/teichoic acid export membrane protein